MFLAKEKKTRRVKSVSGLGLAYKKEKLKR
jgi:hypothetical protein